MSLVDSEIIGFFFRARIRKYVMFRSGRFQCRFVATVMTIRHTTTVHTVYESGEKSAEQYNMSTRIIYVHVHCTGVQFFFCRLNGITVSRVYRMGCFSTRVIDSFFNHPHAHASVFIDGSGGDDDRVNILLLYINRITYAP